MESLIKEKDGVKYIEVDNQLYSLQTVNSTIYKLADICIIQLNKKDESTLQIFFNEIKNNDVNIEYVIKEFMKTLSDQQLRANLEEKFSEIREIVIKKAFSHFNK